MIAILGILRCIGILWKVDTTLCVCVFFLSSVGILRALVDNGARNFDVKSSIVSVDFDYQGFLFW